jgi:MFS family permease
MNNRANSDRQASGAPQWIAFAVVCAGILMVVLDSWGVSVAISAIKSQLQLSDRELAWVSNAYLFAFAGSVLLVGKFSDALGPAAVFRFGVALFAGASFVCGFASGPSLLNAARALQGVAGASLSVGGLSLIMHLFADPPERSKALGVFGSLLASGGTIGTLCGGAIAQALGWQWIFLINVPLGAAVYVASNFFLCAPRRRGVKARFDVLGPMTLTAAPLLTAMAVSRVGPQEASIEQSGWAFIASLICLLLFLRHERTVGDPILPRVLAANRNVLVANAVNILWAAISFSWLFVYSLSLKSLLGFSSLGIAITLLPSTIISGLFSIGLSGRLVLTVGPRPSLAVGLGVAALAMAIASHVPARDGIVFLLPAAALMGIASGIVFNPLMIAATAGVTENHIGLAFGVINTTFAIGGALGLTVVSSVASARTEALAQTGVADLDALVAGYQVAFSVVSGLGVAATLGSLLLGPLSNEKEGRRSLKDSSR